MIKFCTHYFVPNILSPASPNPGNMYAFSFSLLSIDVVYICTSGCLSSTAFMPSGEAIMHRNFNLVTPFSFKSFGKANCYL